MNATKAFLMTVKETASRVKQIVAYMTMMPGYPGGAVCWMDYRSCMDDSTLDPGAATKPMTSRSSY